MWRNGYIEYKMWLLQISFASAPPLIIRLGEKVIDEIEVTQLDS